MPINGNIETIENIVRQRLELPTPPNVVFRLLEVVKDDERSFKEIGDIVTKDPSLTARMMKVANSSIFGLSGKIRTIEGALTVLGINVIRNIALSFVIMDCVKVPSAGPFDIGYFWKRAITSAVAAETIASHIHFQNEDTFLCGLLKDIGVLVMFRQMEKEYQQVLLLKDWGLPESIYLPIFHHHSSSLPASSVGRLVGILQVADLLSALYHGAAGTRDLDAAKDILEKRYGLARPVVKKMIDSMAEKTMEILTYFDIDPGEMKPLSQLLQEANNELGKHALTYEQMLGELKQSQEDSRQFINNLLETNKELRKLAYRDELTGLYNHRFFLSEIDKELERAKRYGHPLSLTFFDIDFFKNINDTYGHLVGDVVLRSIATKVSSCMRSCDIVVRYGGDEFAIIMPETDRAGLESLCERLRQEVEAMDIPLNGNILGVTISVGGACFGGGDGAVTRFSMLSIADQAIYQSKKSGRNTVTIKSVA